MKKLMTMVIFGLMFMLSDVCFGAESVTETPKIDSCLATMVHFEKRNDVYNELKTFYSKDSGNLSVRLYHYNASKTRVPKIIVLDYMQSKAEIKNALRGLLNNNIALSKDNKELLQNVITGNPGTYYLGAINVELMLSGCKDLERIMLDRIEITGEPEELLGFKEVVVSVKDDEIVLRDELKGGSSGFVKCTLYDAANRAELLKALESGVPFGIEFTDECNRCFNRKVKSYSKEPGLWWKWGIIPYRKWEVEKIAFGEPTSQNVSHVKISRLDNARAEFNYHMIKHLKSASMIAILASIGYFLKLQF